MRPSGLMMKRPSNPVEPAAYALTATPEPCTLVPCRLPLRLARMHLIDATSAYEVAREQCLAAIKVASTLLLEVPKGSSALEDDEVLLAAARQLATVLGPIAEILVEKAADRAASVADLYSILSLHIDNTADRERFLSACGRVSGQLKHTILACLAPPTVRTKARFMQVHRLFAWADRRLKLSPAGGAKAGSIFARLRACMDELPACKDLIKRFRADAQGLLECQEILKTKGLSHDTLAQCQPLICAIPSALVRQEFEAYLEYQLATAKAVGLDQVGLPISSDAIASLFGVAKRHGVGQTQDAARIALRLPALCGAPTREEAEQVLGISVARQHEITGQCTSLTKQRREVLGHGKKLESLGQSLGEPQVELLPSPKHRSNHAAIVNLSRACENQYGPHLAPQQTPCVMENVGPPDMREAALT
jgi:hypothetical protein